MAFRVSLGQYVPGDSPIHRLDPRAKVVVAIAFAAAAFVVANPAQLALAAGFVVASIALSRISVGRVLASMRAIWFMLAFLGLINLLVVRQGAVVWSLGPLCVTEVGLSSAVLFPLRMGLGVAMMALLLLSTTPAQLTDAFDAFLSPLSRVGLPGHELAMVFSLMLRFIPTIGDEASAILDAQTVRAASPGEGSPARRVRSLAPAVTALLSSSLRHAENLSRALDARCYEGGSGRTHWHPLRMRPADGLALAACAAVVAGLLLLA